MSGKHFLAVIVSICVIIYLSSCGKAADTTPKITGLWDEYSTHTIERTDGVTTNDDAQRVPSGYNMLQFSADGKYIQYPQGASSISGTYTYVGKVLTLVNSYHPLGIAYTVDSLGPYFMMLHQTDTLSAGPPLVTRDLIVSYSK